MWVSSRVRLVIALSRLWSATEKHSRRCPGPWKASPGTGTVEWPCEAPPAAATRTEPVGAASTAWCRAKVVAAAALHGERRPTQTSTGPRCLQPGIEGDRLLRRLEQRGRGPDPLLRPEPGCGCSRGDLRRAVVGWAGGGGLQGVVTVLGPGLAQCRARQDRRGDRAPGPLDPLRNLDHLSGPIGGHDQRAVVIGANPVARPD